MAMLGSDPQDMAELVSKLASAIEQITSAMSTLDSKAQSVRWEGPDANRFKGTTWPRSKKQEQISASRLNSAGYLFKPGSRQLCVQG
ncbi:hypothetical protein ACX80D_00035 [Arthrobacter sp. Sr24]